MTSKLLQRLQDPVKSGTYRATDAQPIADAVRGSPLDLACLSFAGATDKASLLREAAKQLAFPRTFGANWDALEDSLCDLSWRPVAGHVLVFEDYGAVPHAELGLLMEVLDAAAEFWRGRGRPFFAVFIDPARKLRLPDLHNGA